MTGWQSATPGLVVWQENSAQNDRHPGGGYYPKDQEFWSVWHQPSSAGVSMGFADPESAMHVAAALGRYRDWTRPGWPADTPRPIAIVNDLQARGLW